MGGDGIKTAAPELVDRGVLVCGPPVGMEEAHRDRLDLRRDGRELREIERDELSAIGGDPSRHRQPE